VSQVLLDLETQLRQLYQHLQTLREVQSPSRLNEQLSRLQQALFEDASEFYSWLTEHGFALTPPPETLLPKADGEELRTPEHHQSISGGSSSLPPTPLLQSTKNSQHHGVIRTPTLELSNMSLAVLNTVARERIAAGLSESSPMDEPVLRSVKKEVVVKQVLDFGLLSSSPPPPPVLNNAYWSEE
jgi:hypothetical protein